MSGTMEPVNLLDLFTADDFCADEDVLKHALLERKLTLALNETAVVDIVKGLEETYAETAVKQTRFSAASEIWRKVECLVYAGRQKTLYVAMKFVLPPAKQDERPIVIDVERTVGADATGKGLVISDAPSGTAIVAAIRDDATDLLQVLSRLSILSRG